MRAKCCLPLPDCRSHHQHNPSAPINFHTSISPAHDMPPPDAGFASLAAVHLQIAHAREETSRLRTEVTLASLSLEAEKNALQQTLTTTSATLSSPTATSDEVHILRSLSHQLIATRAGLAQLTQTESELVAERDALALQARLGSDGLAPAGLAETAVMSDDVCRQKFMHAAEEALEGKGNGGEMWREHALPNLGLLRGSKVSCGVVVDRVFEGVAVFTPGVSRTLGAGSALSTKGERECDYEIIRCGRKVMVPQEGLVEKFVRGFKTLLIGDSGGSVTLSAAGEAVECVQHLLETHLPRGMDAKNLAGTRDSANGVNLKVLADPPPKAFVSNPGVGTDSLNASRPLVDEKVGRRGKSRGRSRRRRFRDFSKERVHIAPRMSHMSKVLSPELMGDLLRAAPIRYSQSAMERLYCTDDDGIALGTFLSKVANRYPVFLLIRDTSGGVFGCYGSAAWRESS